MNPRVLATTLVVLAAAAPARAVDDVEPPSITPASSIPWPGSGPAIVECHLIDDSDIFDPIVRWRLPGDADYRQAKLTRSRTTLFRAEVPVPAGATAFEYYIEVFDTNGNGPARLGDKVRPVVVPLASPGAGAPTTAKKEPAPVPERPKVAEKPVEKPSPKPPTKASRPTVPAAALESTEPEPAGGVPWKWVALGAAVVAAGAGAALGVGVMNGAVALEGVPAAEFAVRRAELTSNASLATGAWAAAGALAVTSAVLFVAF